MDARRDIQKTKKQMYGSRARTDGEDGRGGIGRYDVHVHGTDL
jgi:hypothetical protein